MIHLEDSNIYVVYFFYRLRFAIDIHFDVIELLIIHTRCTTARHARQFHRLHNKLLLAGGK